MSALAPVTFTLWTTSDVDGKNVAVGQNVFIRKVSDEAEVVLYQDAEGTMPIPQPLISDSNGQVSAYVQRGTYFVDSLGRRETIVANGFVTIDILVEGAIDEAIEEALRGLTAFDLPIIDYEAGLNVTSTLKPYRYDGSVYLWIGDLPFTTTGDFESETGWTVAQFRNEFYDSGEITGATVNANGGVITVPEYDINSSPWLVLKNGAVLSKATASGYAQSSSTTIAINASLASDDTIVIRGAAVTEGDSGFNQLLNSNVQPLSNYKTLENTWSDAIEAASSGAEFVFFPKNENIEVDTITITESAKCRGWFLNGCTLSVTQSEVIFNNEMDFIDLQGGVIKGGLKLAKVAVSTGKDQTSVTVQQGHGIVVGDYVTSSLDNNYLPNSTSRVGYGEEGDYNRVTSVINNGDGTDTINLTYRFFRSEDGAVYSGWVENTWISGNASFNNRGIQFNQGGNIEIRNGTLQNPQGYLLSVDDGATNKFSVLTLKNINIDNTFIDIVRFRGYGIVSDHVQVSRQYDFSKQLFVVDMVKEGFINIINGCRFERQNRDAEVFATPFDSDGYVECGLITTDGTNYFDGTQPADLPTSDFTPPLQNENIYWGRLVAISDGLHWFVPNADGNHGGIISNGDEFVGYLRSVYGTSFAAKSEFTWGVCQFNGSETNCSPVFNTITTTLDAPLECELNGGKYGNYGTNSFNSGCRTVATNATIFVTDEAIDSPFIDGSAGLNSIQMWGGRLEGRYRIANNLSDFNRVTLPYRGTANQFYNPLISLSTLGDLNSINFFLERPRDGIFEGTGENMDDWYDSLPTNAWFVTNTTSEGAAPPPVRYEIQGVNAIFEVGSELGFDHLYQMTLYTVGSDKPIIETRGKWSGIVKQGDFIYLASAKEYLESSGSQQTTASSAGDAEADPAQTSFTVTDTPTGTPAWVGVYDTQINGWLYYPVDSVSGGTINLVDSVRRDFSIGADVTLIYLKQDQTVTNYAHYKSGFDNFGALVPTIQENVTNVFAYSSGSFRLGFETPFFVDDVSISLYDAANNKAYIVNPRPSLNNVERTDYRFSVYRDDGTGSIEEVTSAAELEGCVLEFYAASAKYRS